MTEPDSRPASLVLVHGAGSGPWIYDRWAEAFPGIRVRAVDLQQGLDVGSASMMDYADRVVAAAHRLPRPVALCGWSMGGLVVLLAAERVRPHSVILIEPSPPAEVQGNDPAVSLASGTFDPQAVYGPFPSGVPARAESSFARAERKRGISVPSLSCPSLVISGAEFPDDRGRRIARLYGSEERRFPALDHWQLVLDPQVRETIGRFLLAEGDRRDEVMTTLTDDVTLSRLRAGAARARARSRAARSAARSRTRSRARRARGPSSRAS